MAPISPTLKSPRSQDEVSRDDGDLDLLAGLWREAPFARLPADAPPELQVLVADVEDPRRVYAIHRAARRHDFQSLVAEYVTSDSHLIRNFLPN